MGSSKSVCGGDGGDGGGDDDGPTAGGEGCKECTERSPPGGPIGTGAVLARRAVLAACGGDPARPACPAPGGGGLGLGLIPLRECIPGWGQG